MLPTFANALRLFSLLAGVSLLGPARMDGGPAREPIGTTSAAPATPANDDDGPLPPSPELPSPITRAQLAPTGAAPLSAHCLAETLCRLKDAVRWRSPAWNSETCGRIAEAVLAAADKYQLSPALILGVMLNESDLDEKAATPYYRGGALYAKDSGLMGIRCVFDGRGRCVNGHVRGMRARDVANPVTNIELGARELAYTRDAGGVERRTVRERNPKGQLVTRTKLLRCRHQSHAYWAHYNHGSFYRTSGYARHYPHRVAVLYYALARSLGLPDDEVTSGPLTVRDKGLRARTADRPIETRYRTLAGKIYENAPKCGADNPDNTVLASSTSPHTPTETP